VSPVELVLRAAGAVRPAPAAGRLHACAAWAWAYVRSAPVTFSYLAILVATTAVIETASARTADRLLLARSTNLDHLGHDPLRVLVASAFWVGGVEPFIAAAALLVLVLAHVERRIGGLRMACIFAIGHVGATLVTAAGLWIGTQADLVDRSVAGARDVGASYGCLAVAGALTYLLARRLRVSYAAALLACALLALGLTRSFTGVGHVLSVLLGLACYSLVRPRVTPAPDG
jgi:uncharacterized membrane protein (GlpM family)